MKTLQREQRVDFYTVSWRRAICERFISSRHIWCAERFICMQSHSTKRECLSVTGGGSQRPKQDVRVHVQKEHRGALPCMSNIEGCTHQRSCAQTHTQQTCLISALILAETMWDEIKSIILDRSLNEQFYILYFHSRRLWIRLAVCCFWRHFLYLMIMHACNKKYQEYKRQISASII